MLFMILQSVALEGQFLVFEGIAICLQEVDHGVR